MKPRRVQRKRTRGWRMPPNTISVTRPGPWGNPFALKDYSAEEAVILFRDMMINPFGHKLPELVRQKFEYIRRNIGQLKGKNLACYCKPGAPCHADALLELANN